MTDFLRKKFITLSLPMNEKHYFVILYSFKGHNDDNF